MIQLAFVGLGGLYLKLSSELQDLLCSRYPVLQA